MAKAALVLTRLFSLACLVGFASADPVVSVTYPANGAHGIRACLLCGVCEQSLLPQRDSSAAHLQCPIHLCVHSERRAVQYIRQSRCRSLQHGSAGMGLLWRGRQDNGSRDCFRNRRSYDLHSHGCRCRGIAHPLCCGGVCRCKLRQGYCGHSHIFRPFSQGVHGEFQWPRYLSQSASGHLRFHRASLGQMWWGLQDSCHRDRAEFSGPDSLYGELRPRLCLAIRDRRQRISAPRHSVAHAKRATARLRDRPAWNICLCHRGSRDRGLFHQSLRRNTG